ncbi:MAG: hypothetical protein WCD37_08780 [Chloroflexia bacterium]
MDSSDVGVSLFRLMVISIYVVGVVSSLLVGAIGVSIIVAILIVSPDMLLFGAALALPIIAICAPYLSFVIRLLFSKSWQHKKYRAWSWILALLGICIMWAVGLFVFYGTRGI